MDPHGGEHGGEGFWTEPRFRLAAYVGTALVMLAVLYARFDYGHALPPKPPPPPPPKPVDLRQMDYKIDLYEGYLKQDSLRYAVPLTTPADLSRVFPYERMDSPQPLLPGAPPLETRALRLSTYVEKGKFKTPHLVLRIENRLDRPVAYQVVTATGRDPSICARKEFLKHNAIAIPAGQAVERTECQYSDKMEFRVLRVETMELTPLSFFYVSRLSPNDIGLDPRPSSGHQIPNDLPRCALNNATIAIDMQKNLTTWRDLIDFYARHRCDTYRWLRGYRAWTQDKQVELPVPPHAVEAGP